MKLLDAYLSKLPHRPSHFHIHPLEDIPLDFQSCGVHSSLVGVNIVNAVLPKLFEESGCGC